MQNNNTKHKHTAFKIIIIVVLSIIICISSASVFFAFSDYNYNRLLAGTDDIIYDQDSNLVSSFKYGGLGTVGDNGCGAICAYNIMKLEGKNVDFANVIRYFDIGGTFAFGKLGTNPFTIMSYLRKYGFDCSLKINTSTFEQEAKQSKYAIYLFVSTYGGHYQLMHDYDNLSGKFSCINKTGLFLFSQLEQETEDAFIKLLITVN